MLNPNLIPNGRARKIRARRAAHAEGPLLVLTRGYRTHRTGKPAALKAWDEQLAAEREQRYVDLAGAVDDTLPPEARRTALRRAWREAGRRL